MLLLLVLVVGPVLLIARHRPLHPLSCPVAIVDVCGAAAAATVYSSVGISCSTGRRLHGGVHKYSWWGWGWQTALHGGLFSFLMHGRGM